ncbi:hypothetical protein BC835DRAFT_1521308 [Cytidiella melzeri]|nr:hypothetical protein BC835DRAFT_1524585 [Cytidiella melzeri]KAI0691228.1 hypothetical protein BC835DRAFT_1521308 [Cytidiella melzeri]
MTPWVAKLTCDSLSVMHPEVDEKAQYRNEQSQEKAHLADMWDVLAANPDVKPILGLAGWLPGTFCEMVSAEKCKFVHAAVGNIVDIFGSLGLTSNKLGTPAAQKTCNTLQAMGPQHHNNHYCLLLFPDEHPGDILWLFWTKRIVFVIKSSILAAPPLAASRARSLVPSAPRSVSAQAPSPAPPSLCPVPSRAPSPDVLYDPRDGPPAVGGVVRLGAPVVLPRPGAALNPVPPPIPPAPPGLGPAQISADVSAGSGSLDQAPPTNELATLKKHARRRAPAGATVAAEGQETITSRQLVYLKP